MNKKYKGYIVAESMLHHGGNIKTGSQQMLRRIKFFANGKFVEIPYISGNAMRGRLRRLSMSDLLQQLDYKIENLRLHHILFSGGTLTTVSTKDTGTIDFDLRRKVQKYLPMISLFGTAMGNQIMAGKLTVGNMVPVCKELGTGKYSVNEFLDWTYQTRKDDLHLEREEDEQAQQMLYEFEVFIPGTTFLHSFTLLQPSDLEVSAFGRMMELFQDSPFIGAMAAVGMGKIRMEYGHFPESVTYLNFLEQNKKEITEVLKEIEKKV